MQIIDYYIDHIKDELDGAKEYAEKVVEYKPQLAKMYQEMAQAELNHAKYLVDMGNQCYAQITEIYAPQELEDEWNKILKRYTERTALARHLLDV